MNHRWIIMSVSAVALSTVTFATASSAKTLGQDRRAPSFEELDTDGDGLLSEAEMLARRAVRFSETDIDGDGLLSADEMSAKPREAALQRIQQGVARRIARQDQNGDGMISLDEMAPPQGRGALMFSRFDENGDGAISEDEFQTALQWRQGYRAGRRHRRGTEVE